jgi:hypothetical protein
MSCSELVGETGFRGSPVAFSSAVCVRLGRAIGTWLRRQGHGAQHVVMARLSNGGEADVRDGLVCGLVLAGLHLVDAGCVGHDRFVATLQAPPVPVVGGLSLSSTDDAITLNLFYGVRVVNDAALNEVAALADAGVFAAARPLGIDVLDTALFHCSIAADHTLADE